MNRPIQTLDHVVVRFAGDSGDGMQLTGTKFTESTALAGNDLSTFPDFPAEIRAPAGTMAGVSGFQIHFSSEDIHTPADFPDVLVALNPAALRANVEDALHYHDDLVATALNAIRDCAVPTVAAIRGACVGGGLEIAGCCDIRIAGESSRFGAPINRLGFSMYPGEMAGLLALVGPAVVLEILLEGRILSAREALQKGLLSRVVDDEKVFEDAAACAARICAGAPLVARWHKQWVKRLMGGGALSDAEKREAFAFLDTEDYREGLEAFLAKRPPVFRGR